MLISWDELTLTHWLGRVLPLGEVSRKMGFKLPVLWDQQEHVFWEQLASVPGWRFSAGITHLLNSYCKNLNKWRRKKNIKKTNHPHLWLPTNWGCCAMPSTPGQGSLGGQLQCQRKIPLSVGRRHKGTHIPWVSDRSWLASSHRK